jgi:hypothetical protein
MALGRGEFVCPTGLNRSRESVKQSAAPPIKFAKKISLNHLIFIQ